MKKNKTCSRFRPSEFFDSATPVSSQCSHCAFFGSRNCHKSAMDFLEDSEDMY